MRRDQFLSADSFPFSSPPQFLLSLTGSFSLSQNMTMSPLWVVSAPNKTGEAFEPLQHGFLFASNVFPELVTQTFVEVHAHKQNIKFTETYAHTLTHTQTDKKDKNLIPENQNWFVFLSLLSSPKPGKTLQLPTIQTTQREGCSELL